MTADLSPCAGARDPRRMDQPPRTISHRVPDGGEPRSQGAAEGRPVRLTDDQRRPSGPHPSGGLLAVAPGLPRLRVFVLFGFELRDQFLVGRAHDDRVELCAVVGDEADALDVDIEDPPAAVPLEHAIVHRDFGPLLRDDPRPDRGLVAVHLLTGVDKPLARVTLDPRNVRALEEVTEQPDELLALCRRARLPVAAEAPLRDLPEVENLVGDRAERRPARRRLRILLELGVLEDFQDAVDPAVELITRRARPGARASDGQEGAGEHGRREARPHVGTNLITARNHATPPHETPRNGLVTEAVVGVVGMKVLVARKPS